MIEEDMMPPEVPRKVDLISVLGAPDVMIGRFPRILHAKGSWVRLRGDPDKGDVIIDRDLDLRISRHPTKGEVTTFERGPRITNKNVGDIVKDVPSNCTSMDIIKSIANRTGETPVCIIASETTIEIPIDSFSDAFGVGEFWHTKVKQFVNHGFLRKLGIPSFNPHEAMRSVIRDNAQMLQDVNIDSNRIENHGLKSVEVTQGVYPVVGRHVIPLYVGPDAILKSPDGLNMLISQYNAGSPLSDVETYEKLMLDIPGAPNMIEVGVLNRIGDRIPWNIGRNPLSIGIG